MKPIMCYRVKYLQNLRQIDPTGMPNLNNMESSPQSNRPNSPPLEGSAQQNTLCLQENNMELFMAENTEMKYKEFLKLYLYNVK